MPTSLEELCATFSEELLAQYQLIAERGIRPGQYRWLNSALIFVALENCRKHCVHAVEPPTPEEELYCRYTLGALDDQDIHDIRELLDLLRGTNPTLQELPNRLRLFLFDFSISALTLEQGYATRPTDVPVAFRLLLVAESELKRQAHEVTKDLLRLVVASSPVKVMIYRAWGRNLRKPMTRVLKRCGPAGHHSTAGWLFLGVPTYTDWHASQDNTGTLQVWVHSLETGAPEIKLRPNRGWWKWVQLVRQHTFSQCF